MANKEFILASSSERRLQLLQSVNIIPNEVVSPNIDESIKKDEKPSEYVKRIAKEKAECVAKKYQDKYILAADTVIVRGHRILGKPKNAEEEMEFLNLLSGRRHQALSAYCVINPFYQEGKSLEGQKQEKKVQTIAKLVTTAIWVKKLTKQEIDYYIATKEWEGKSGGYAIQGYFQSFVKQINGSISSVIGLPLYEVVNTLKGIGYYKI